MDYRDIIVEEKQEEYKEIHKIIYKTLSRMIFNISFIEASTQLQDSDIDYDKITMYFLHKNIFENLITMVYRGFFDDGIDSTNLIRFKNRVISEYLKDEYRGDIIKSIKSLAIEDKQYKKKIEVLKKNVEEIRNNFIAHGLLEAKDGSIVDLTDIKELVKHGCELFKHLSFNVRTFYNPITEGDGLGFDEEFTFTEKLTERFVKHNFLTSSWISYINCEYGDCFDEKAIKRLQDIVEEINMDRV